MCKTSTQQPLSLTGMPELIILSKTGYVGVLFSTSDPSTKPPSSFLPRIDSIGICFVVGHANQLKYSEPYGGLDPVRVCPYADIVTG